jgi:hypothetical protein
MSDRTQGSVRTGALVGDAAPSDNAPGEPAPATATQSIPSTGAQKAVQPPSTGSSPAAGRPAGGPPGAPPVPPATSSSSATSSSTAAGSSPAAGAATAPAGGTASAAGARARKAPGRGPRRARLQLRHIDTWSALKISLVLSIALFFIWMVAVGILYGVLSTLGVFDTLNELFGQLGSASGSKGGGGDVVTPGIVFGGAAVIGAINIVLMTALCTVGTFIYNLCSDLVGGLELTLSERD